MRDENGGAAPHYVAQVVQNLVFGVSIDTREGVFQNQDPWIANDGSRDCGALLLSTRQGDAALSHNSPILFWKALNISGDAGAFGSIVDLVIAYTIGSKRNVFADRVAEQKRLLGYKAD